LLVPSIGYTIGGRLIKNEMFDAKSITTCYYVKQAAGACDLYRALVWEHAGVHRRSWHIQLCIAINGENGLISTRGIPTVSRRTIRPRPISSRIR